MLSTLHQQFPSNLLAQPVQHVQMLVELLGSAAYAGVLHLPQPLRPMAGIVDVPSRTRNRPAAIQRFQAAHDARQILNSRERTRSQFTRRANLARAMLYT